jgi:hypothetical protein
MSKISIVEGDIIEVVGGNDVSYAKGEIVNSGSTVIQAGKENGVIHGTNKPVPFIEFDTQIALIAEFEPLAGYNGEFGFDWLKCDDSDSVLKVQTDNIVNLEYVFDDLKQEYISVSTDSSIVNKIKKEYKKFPLKLPYYIPWLSLLNVNQEIKLNMICKPVISGEDITNEEISFKKNDFYEVMIDGQTNENIKYKPDGKPKEITIKCVKPTEEVSITAIDKNGKEIGKINTANNSKIYDLPVRLICVVKDTPNKEIEISKLIADFKSNQIEEYLNKNSLNQALIRTSIEIDSKYRIAFDENNWNGKFYDKTNNFFIDRKDSSGGRVSYIDDDGDEIKEAKEEHILDKFLRDYKTTFEADGIKFKGILLFLSNIKKDPNDKEGGVSRTTPVSFREAIVFETNLNKKSTYAHEIAHALGLEHYFWRDAEYKSELDELKNSIKSNEEAKKRNNDAIEKNKKAKRTNSNIINERNQEIKKWKTEKAKPTYPYKKEAQDRIDYLEKENAETVKINEKIDGYIKRNEEYNSNIEKILKKQRENLDVYKNNKYKFKEKSTLNIMDYSSATNIYAQWQWKIMQKDVKSYYGSIIENK